MPWKGHRLRTDPTPTHVLHSRKTIGLGERQILGATPVPGTVPVYTTTAVSLGTLVKSYLTQLVTECFSTP